MGLFWGCYFLPPGGCPTTGEHHHRAKAWSRQPGPAHLFTPPVHPPRSPPLFSLFFRDFLEFPRKLRGGKIDFREKPGFARGPSVETRLFKAIFTAGRASPPATSPAIFTAGRASQPGQPAQPAGPANSPGKPARTKCLKFFRLIWTR